MSFNFIFYREMEVDTQKARDHSIKVPRLYKVAANIFKQFEEGKDSVKNLVFNQK